MHCGTQDTDNSLGCEGKGVGRTMDYRGQRGLRKYFFEDGKIVTVVYKVKRRTHKEGGAKDAGKRLT